MSSAPYSGSSAWSALQCTGGFVLQGLAVSVGTATIVKYHSGLECLCSLILSFGVALGWFGLLSTSLHCSAGASRAPIMSGRAAVLVAASTCFGSTIALWMIALGNKAATHDGSGQWVFGAVASHAVHDAMVGGLALVVSQGWIIEGGV